MKLKIFNVFNFFRAGAAALALCLSFILPAKAADVTSDVVTIPADGGLASVSRWGDTGGFALKFAYSIVPRWINWVQAEASYGGPYNLKDSSSYFWSQYWEKTVFTAQLAKNTGAQRTFTIQGSYRAYPEIDGSVKFVQLGADTEPELSVEKESVALANNEAAEFWLRVTANVRYNISCSASWLTCSQTQGRNEVGTFSLEFSAEANTTESERSATITLSYGNLKKIVTVTQPGLPDTLQGALNCSDLEFRCEGVEWYAESTDFASGENNTSAARSAGVLPGKESVLVTDTKERGTISFYAARRGSTSGKLTFSVDGEEEWWRGAPPFTGFLYYSFSLEPGQHTLKWTYSNSSSNTPGYAIVDRVKWRPETLITFDNNDGSGTTTEKTYGVGATYTFPSTPTRAGSWRFLGWFTKPIGGAQVTNDSVVAKDGTRLYAHWQETVSVSFNAGTGTLTTKSKTFDVGKAYGDGLPQPTPTLGYEFVGWTDVSGNLVDAETLVSSSVTMLTAKYKEIEYDFQFSGFCAEIVAAGDLSRRNYFLSQDQNVALRFNVKEAEDRNFPQLCVYISVSGLSNSKQIGLVNKAGLALIDLGAYPLPGVYTVEILLNAVNKIPESDETNNAYTLQFEVKASPSEIPTATQMNVALDANGGSGAPSSISVPAAGSYGESLPTPMRIGYVFQGWFTEAAGGVKITAQTSVNIAVKKLYARWILESDVPVDPINLPDEITFSADAETRQFSTSWKVRSTVSWARVSQTGSTLIVSVGKNSSAAPRTGMLVATSGKERKTLRVTQNAGIIESNIESAVHSYRFSAEGGSIDFQISYGRGNNLKWIASKGADWISLEAIPYNEEFCGVHLAVEKNDSSTSREAYVLIFNEYEQMVTLKISQAGTSAPVRDEAARDNPELAGALDSGELFEQVWLDAGGDEHSWTLPDDVVGEPFFLDQSWLDGFAEGGTLTVRATENPGELRETFIFFRTEDGGVYALFVKQNEE